MIGNVGYINISISVSNVISNISGDKSISVIISLCAEDILLS